MVDDMDYELKLPSVGELTFPQWRDWLVRYNKFIGERDVEHAAKLRERDDRIEKLEAALREIEEAGVPRTVAIRWRSDGSPSKHDKCAHGMAMYEDCANCIADYARKALEGEDG